MPKGGTACGVTRRAVAGKPVQASRLRLFPRLAMSNIFMAGPELVRWELTACGHEGPYRLVISHARGSIVEYFPTPTAALVREAELEHLLIAARGGPPRASEAA